MANALPPQPAWSSLWAGPLEAGDTHFSCRAAMSTSSARRAVSASPKRGGSRAWDSYDLIEWIAQQPWCDGNVGMVGISGFGAEQLLVAQQIRRISRRSSVRPARRLRLLGSFREEYPGGVLHLFRYLVCISPPCTHQRQPGALPPEPRHCGGGDGQSRLSACIRTSTTC